MTDYRVTVHGDDDLDRELRRAILFLTDLRPFWPRVATLFRGWTRLQFDSEGAFWSIGGKWAPLAPSTRARKAALGLRLQILQETGQARRAASNPKRRATPRSLTLTIDDSGPAHGPVLQYHQEGGPRLPRRPILDEDLPPLASLELRREAAGYLRDVFSGLR